MARMLIIFKWSPAIMLAKMLEFAPLSFHSININSILLTADDKIAHNLQVFSPQFWLNPETSASTKVIGGLFLQQNSILH